MSTIAPQMLCRSSYPSPQSNLRYYLGLRPKVLTTSGRARGKGGLVTTPFLKFWNLFYCFVFLKSRFIILVFTLYFQHNWACSLAVVYAHVSSRSWVPTLSSHFFFSILLCSFQAISFPSNPIFDIGWGAQITQQGWATGVEESHAGGAKAVCESTNGVGFPLSL